MGIFILNLRVAISFWISMLCHCHAWGKFMKVYPLYFFDLCVCLFNLIFIFFFYHSFLSWPIFCLLGILIIFESWLQVFQAPFKFVTHLAIELWATTTLLTVLPIVLKLLFYPLPPAPTSPLHFTLCHVLFFSCAFCYVLHVLWNVAFKIFFY